MVSFFILDLQPSQTTLELSILISHLLLNITCNTLRRTSFVPHSTVDKVVTIFSSQICASAPPYTFASFLGQLWYLSSSTGSILAPIPSLDLLKVYVCCIPRSRYLQNFACAEFYCMCYHSYRRPNFRAHFFFFPLKTLLTQGGVGLSPLLFLHSQQSFSVH